MLEEPVIDGTIWVIWLVEWIVDGSYEWIPYSTSTDEIV